MVIGKHKLTGSPAGAPNKRMQPDAAKLRR